LLADAGLRKWGRQDTGKPLVIYFDTHADWRRGGKSRIDWLTRQFQKIEPATGGA